MVRISILEVRQGALGRISTQYIECRMTGMGRFLPIENILAIQNSLTGGKLPTPVYRVMNVNVRFGGVQETAIFFRNHVWSLGSSSSTIEPHPL